MSFGSPFFVDVAVPELKWSENVRVGDRQTVDCSEPETTCTSMKDYTVIPALPSRNIAALGYLDALQDSFVTSILDSSPDCIKLIELDGRLSYMNHNGMCAMEIDDFCTVENKPWPSLWPEKAQHLLQSAIEDAASGNASEFEALCPTAKRNERWWNVSVRPVFSKNGEVERILATSRDITDRVLSEKALLERDAQIQEANRKLAKELSEKESLLELQRKLVGEIDHRVKNSFALISGILVIKMRGLPDGEAKQVLRDAANRIATLARVHEQLHFNPDDPHVPLTAFITELSRGLAVSLAEGNSVNVTSTTDFEMKSDQIVGVGLVVAELISNALRHASDRSVTVEVALSEDENQIVCSVSDDGNGLPFDFDVKKSKGLGMRIGDSYAQQFSGSFTARNRPEGGAEFRFSFPMTVG